MKVESIIKLMKTYEVGKLYVIYFYYRVLACNENTVGDCVICACMPYSKVENKQTVHTIPIIL